MRQGALAALLMLVVQGDTDETGLSKGPENPADLGSRCAPIAGREDRAYLDCGRQGFQPSTSRGSGNVPPEQLRPDQFGIGREGTGRRYPVRGR
jgi:hypothetical protein